MLALQAASPRCAAWSQVVQQYGHTLTMAALTRSRRAVLLPSTVRMHAQSLQYVHDQTTACRICGVSPFYVPRSNPDGYGVNLWCCDQSTFSSIKVHTFEGADWERAYAKRDYARLSRPRDAPAPNSHLDTSGRQSPAMEAMQGVYAR